MKIKKLYMCGNLTDKHFHLECMSELYLTWPFQNAPGPPSRLTYNMHSPTTQRPDFRSTFHRLFEAKNFKYTT